MPSYIPNVLQQYNHPIPPKPEHSPPNWTPIKYGHHNNHPTPIHTSKELLPKQIKWLQQVIGSLLYYSRAVDPTLLVAIGDISSQQSKCTISTMTETINVLNYISTYPLAIQRYHSNSMTLNVHSDAS